MPGEQIAGAILGIGLQSANDGRQVNQQRELTHIQSQAQKDLTDYNQEKAYQMWLKTNYPAQVEQLKKAGLNPGMLYGMGGAGGATSNVSPGNVTGATAPQGGREVQDLMGIGLQMELLEAQKEVMKSEAEKNRAEAAATGGYRKELSESQTGLNTQLIKNEELRNEILKFESSNAQLDNSVKRQTINDAMSNIESNAKQAAEIARKLKIEADIAQSTKDEMIRKIEAESIGVAVHNSLMASEINLNTETVNKITAEIKNLFLEPAFKIWHLTNEQRSSLMYERFVKFNTAQSQRTFENIMSGVDKAIGIFKKGGGTTNIESQTKNIILPPNN